MENSEIKNLKEKYSYNNKMQECQFKLEHLKKDFDIALLSNIIVTACFLLYDIFCIDNDTLTTPLLFAIILIGYIPISVITYIKKEPKIYIYISAVCLILFFIFWKIVLLAFVLMNIGYFISTKNIYKLKKMPEYPHFNYKK